MKSVILFDLDGTLLYTLPSITAAMNRTLKRFGLEAISLERVRELVGNSSRYLVEHAIKESGGSDWSKEQCEHFLDAYNADYLSHSIEGTTPYPGAEALLDALKEEGKQLWVYSNKSIMRAFFRRHQNYFVSFILSSCRNENHGK